MRRPCWSAGMISGAFRRGCWRRYVSSRLWWRIDAIGLIHGGEVVLQQPMDEDVTATDFTEE
jgi:hypothetical protein